jgi:hypothetical protein
MLADFGVPPDPRWQANALMCLGQWLMQRCREGRVPVLIVDEAQGLPLQVLEEIRMLLNLETPQEKLLQIVLVGQPELEEKLNRPEARQIKQRISLRCKTAALTAKETRDYVQARLDVAGAAGRTIFSPDAVEAVHAYSRGIPRVMNLLCEHALINAYAANMRVVPARMLDEVAREFHFDREKYVPSIYSKARDVSSPSDHEEIFSAILSQPPFHPTPAPIVRTEDATASLPFTASVEPAPIYMTPTVASDHLPEASLPMPVAARANRWSDTPATATYPSSAQPPVKNSATARSRIRRVSFNDRVLATLRNMRSRNLLSPTQKSRLLRGGRDFRRTLYNLSSRVLDKHRLEELRDAASAVRASGARRISNAFSKLELSLRGLGKDAGPVWQRIQTFSLQWLGRPLRLRQLSDESFKQSGAVTRGQSASLVRWPSVNRAHLTPRKEIKSLMLPSSEPRMNLIVMRWLRQPFRASASARPPRVHSRHG